MRTLACFLIWLACIMLGIVGSWVYAASCWDESDPSIGGAIMVYWVIILLPTGVVAGMITAAFLCWFIPKAEKKPEPGY